MSERFVQSEEVEHRLVRVLGCAVVEAARGHWVDVQEYCIDATALAERLAARPRRDNTRGIDRKE